MMLTTGHKLLAAGSACPLYLLMAAIISSHSPLSQGSHSSGEGVLHSWLASWFETRIREKNLCIIFQYTGHLSQCQGKTVVYFHWHQYYISARFDL